jgi:hypothetical protein
LLGCTILIQKDNLITTGVITADVPEPET